MTFEELQRAVLTWGSERGILPSDTPQAQFLRCVEELGELAAAMARQQPAQIADALGAVMVTLMLLAHLLDRDPVIRREGADEEIHLRQGRMVNGVFVKAQRA